MTNRPPLPPRPSIFDDVSTSTSLPNTKAQDGTSQFLTLLSPQDATHVRSLRHTKSHPYGLSSREWDGEDPRSSSMQSLRPYAGEHDGQRTLLMIYIHGFLGDETSFQSFPAHVHTLLAATLADSHVIHTKIYPRYKSRKHISFARDELSQWYLHVEMRYARLTRPGFVLTNPPLLMLSWWVTVWVVY